MHDAKLGPILLHIRMANLMHDTPVFIAVRPNGQLMRVVSGGSVRDCWNRLVAETSRSIAELKREGWRVEREADEAVDSGA